MLPAVLPTRSADCTSCLSLASHVLPQAQAGPPSCHSPCAGLWLRKSSWQCCGLGWLYPFYSEETGPGRSNRCPRAAGRIRSVQPPAWGSGLCVGAPSPGWREETFLTKASRLPLARGDEVIAQLVSWPPTPSL